MALYTGTTSQIIILSVMGAVLMYMVSMISLFILRKREPDLERPFASPFYPYFPAIALLLSAICFGAIIYYNGLLSLIFLGGLIVTVLIFVLMGKHKVRITDDALLEKDAILTETE